MTNDYHKSRTNAPQQGADRSKLTIGEIATLQEKIIPTARGWVRENPPGSTLHDHGAKTLQYRGEAP
jgi:hypothetical protein